MKKGDIVLVRFPFTDFESEKVRPAVVLMPENFYRVGKIITLQISLLASVIGSLLPNHLAELNRALKRIFKLT